MSAINWVVLLLTHPVEFRTLVQFNMYHKKKRDIAALKEHPTTGWYRSGMRRCWELLDMTSRSYSAVIKELDGDLVRTIALFYLVLRGLDTIEDDMTIADEIKQPLLRSFHIHSVTPGWKYDGCGPNERDRQLLVEYDTVVEEFNLLLPEYKNVILDITQKMATGMADYAHKAATSSDQSIYIASVAEYDLYCHYVAGLLGEGLSRLFSASGKESPSLGLQLELSNSMGLLLQKTNIIRDFREDVEEKRFFWPREIWGSPEYGGFTELKEMCATDAETVTRAKRVQSGMVLNALRHATDAMDYLRLLRNQSVFTFCAIPVTMAIATLELCFMNAEMFQRNIKIRKAQAADLVMRSTNPREVGLIFREYARRIHAKAVPSDPNFIRISVACGKIEAWCEHNYPTFVHFTPSGQQMVNPSDARGNVLLKEQAFDAELLKKFGPGTVARANGVDGEHWVQAYDPTRGMGTARLVVYVAGALGLVLLFGWGVVWGVTQLD
ncbi:isoprenoid synthase domain-containing protein [Gymnopilus junonius]|uniref:squalene synthase n=1 Tax=Gymnopilus junonius TaxID=109634 RepID=A0A9P5NW38_GYMJU|nr:isoprenoid synthase domain-containing protein [Gymnopilus junonius]